MPCKITNGKPICPSEVTPTPTVIMYGETNDYTSPHRSTSTGATFVIKRTRQFTSTPKTTTPLHTQASIPSNTQPSIFSQSREHSPNTVTTRTTSPSTCNSANKEDTPAYCSFRAPTTTTSPGWWEVLPSCCQETKD
uniref:Uncharacterized protein n=1 Tax=Magallana gigas TaxID=29159 RepID=A0A8W8ML00_MAGGI